MANTPQELKRDVAAAALRFVRPGSVLGVGTGSTVDLFIDALAAANPGVSQAVSRSERSTAKLRAIGLEVLGRFPLPVEVIPMARAYVARELAKLGGEPRGREGTVTDNGNVILDVHGLSITDPVATEARIDRIVGVVTNGLFAARGADVLLLGEPGGVREMRR